MKLQFIGAGSAFTTGGNYHSNMLLKSPAGNRILLDCGTDARHALHELGLTYQDINHVYISHLHADHAGGLEWLGFARKFDPSTELAELFISELLATRVWENTLSGGMRSIAHVDCKLSTFFDVHAISLMQNFFIWEQQRFDLVPVKHIYDNQCPAPCFGLRYKINDRTIWWTADLMFKPDELQQEYHQADLIFHDCETTPFASTVHPNYKELLQLPAEIKRKIWLYHYNPGALPNAVLDGFKGFVQKGQEFDLTDPDVFK